MINNYQKPKPDSSILTTGVIHNHYSHKQRKYVKLPIGFRKVRIFSTE